VNTETYGIALVLDIWSSRRDLVRKTADIVAKVFLIVDCVDNLTETARLASLLAAFEWADIQAVTQKELLVKGC
jgi:hypothetical protein